MNPRPLAYGASELPDCSTAQFFVCLLSKNGSIIAYIIWKVKGKKYTLPFVVGRALRCGGMNRDSSRSQRNQLEFAVALASEVVSHGSTFTFVTERLSPPMTPNADHLLYVSRVIVTESFSSQ